MIEGRPGGSSYVTLHRNKECDVGDYYLLILYIYMRKFALICFVVAVLCYGLGALFAYYDWLIDWNDYLKIIAVVGGLASVLGILGLVFSPFKDLNSKMLKELANNTEEYEKREKMLQDATNKIANLKLQAKDLDALVKKASLSLHYKAELKWKYDKLVELVRENEDISKLIDEIKKIESDAKTLDCEIDMDKNVKGIIEIIQKANERTERKLRFTDLVLSFLGNQIIVKI